MSVDSVQRLHDEFVGRIDMACAAGRGDELLLGYLSAIGRDQAARVFLCLTSAAADETAESAMAVWRREHQLRTATIEVLDGGVREALGLLGSEAAAFADFAAATAVRAFVERLDQMLDTAQTGGRA